jgi:hypothetical protein
LKYWLIFSEKYTILTINISLNISRSHFSNHTVGCGIWDKILSNILRFYFVMRIINVEYQTILFLTYVFFLNMWSNILCMWQNYLIFAAYCVETFRGACASLFSTSTPFSIADDLTPTIISCRFSLWIHY